MSDHIILDQTKHQVKPITEFGSVGIFVFVSFNVNAFYSISHPSLVPNPLVSLAWVADIKRGRGGENAKSHLPLPRVSTTATEATVPLLWYTQHPGRLLVYCLFRDFQFFSLQLYLLFADDYFIVYDGRKYHEIGSFEKSGFYCKQALVGIIRLRNLYH